MIIAGQLIGLPIMVNNNLTGYTIKEHIYSTSHMKLLGFCLSVESRDKKNRVLSLKRAKEIKKDGILIHSENDILSLHQLPDLEAAFNENKKIINYDIKDEKGALIGVIKDTIIDEKNGKIKGFIISQGIITDLAMGYSILPLVPEVKLQETGFLIGDIGIEELLLNQQGGLQKLFGIDKTN